MIRLKEPWELALMRANGRRLAEVAKCLSDAIKPGITTIDLDRMAEEHILAMGAIPSFKGYQVGEAAFPNTICASPNEQVVHGIPTRTPLKLGDIISIDMGLHYGGYHADMAFTVALGEVPEEVQRLIDATRKSLYAGISAAKPGVRVGDIGHAIESVIKPLGFGIIRQYAGHGIGRALHEHPLVPNYGKKNTGVLIKPGMCLAIEPMTTLGTWKTKTLKDEWTVVTADSSLSAHFEHTIAITPDGAEILTVV